MTSMVEVSPIYMAPIPGQVAKENTTEVEAPPIYMAPIPSASTISSANR